LQGETLGVELLSSELLLTSAGSGDASWWRICDCVLVEGEELSIAVLASNFSFDSRLVGLLSGSSRGVDLGEPKSLLKTRVGNSVVFGMSESCFVSFVEILDLTGRGGSFLKLLIGLNFLLLY
jgi:hypothetical protein